ncbi:hypothetical protein [Aequorivita marisscotiae]|uniref:Uncharacterized protein n=1 Tax=Aequorivita marisscotiae TaxID=3040348 RepID=A0ABY8KP49_9FLAO|nr:hypothetical protein [Aequorivita sp. Ant34-E75]WGF91230.1 hypothetical protein QCQ61_08355 [Aequorivita sp. Ant34-E75]
MKKKENTTNENLPYNPEVTDHDKDILNQKNIHGDGGDDQQLKDRKNKVDFEGKDLDIPGRSKAKKQNNPNGLRDEENQLHSQGGESKNNLERDDAAL